MDKRIYSHS